MSSKLSTSLRAITLHANEIGHLSHKPMWVMPDGSVAIKDGIELIVLGKEDFFYLLHHGSVDSIGVYGTGNVPDAFDSVVNMYLSWPPNIGVEKSISWSDLVEADQGDPPTPPVKQDDVASPKPSVITQIGNGTGPPQVTPTTEARVYTQVNSRIVPVPLVVVAPESSHPSLNYLKEKGGNLPYPCFDKDGKVSLGVPYKRVRLGSLCFKFDELGNKELEMDPNRIDISSGPGSATKRLHRSFSLFS
jgi:hypothetical protein